MIKVLYILILLVLLTACTPIGEFQMQVNATCSDNETVMYNYDYHTTMNVTCRRIYYDDGKFGINCR